MFTFSIFWPWSYSLGLCLRNICLVLAISVMKYVWKLTSWWIYKNNCSSIKLSYKTKEKRQLKPDNSNKIIKAEHLRLKCWEDFDGISYQKLLYILEIIKAKLINRHLNDILIRDLESKKSSNWPKILLIIIMMFELLQRSIKYFFW